MTKRKQPRKHTEMDTHDLWVLAFRLRAEASLELEEMKPREWIVGTLGLLGQVMNELRSRGLQGRLEI